MKSHLSRLKPYNYLLAAVAMSAPFVQADTQVQSKPDALLQVDMTRPAVVEKIVTAWSKELPAAQLERVKEKLMGLRADQLLAATLSGSFDGVLEVLERAETAQQAFSVNTTKAKAVGDATQDLAYTPVTPCRMIDTRNSGAGILLGGTKRDFDVITTSCANQGGTASNCGIDPGAVAIAVNLTSTGAPGGGNLRAYSSSLSAPPNASNVNYPGQSIQISEANFAIVPICTTNCPSALEMSVLASS